MNKIKIIFAALCLVFALSTKAQSEVKGDAIIGVWESGSGKARINIIKSGSSITASTTHL